MRFAALCLLTIVGLLAGCQPAVETGSLGAAPLVPKYGIHELTFERQVAGNPFWDAQARATYTSPSGQRIDVEGFYFGDGLYKVRFVPREHGRWTYKAQLRHGGETLRQAGGFACEGTSGDGFLRVSQRNCFRMEYESGRPFYPIGVENAGIFQAGFDGPTDDGKWRAVPLEEWCKAFDGAVNLQRILMNTAEKGAAERLIMPGGPLDRYNTDFAAKLDKAYRLVRSHGISQMMILFQDMSPYSGPRTVFGRPTDTEDYKSLRSPNLPDQEKYLRYLVARYGCFVDIWEIFNEDTYASDEYLAHLYKVIRQADPYDHIITVNYPRPDKPFCDIIVPHEYMAIPANQTDVYLSKQIGSMKAFGKVVQYSEFGNKGELPNDDPIKWRLAVWACFMNESGMLFWNMSGVKAPGKPNASGNTNTYLGPESRQHFRVLNEFTKDLPVDMRPLYMGMPSSNQIRGYGLANDKVAVLYVHHYTDYSKAVEGETLFVTIGPGRFRVRWIDPETGKQVGEEKNLRTRQQFLNLNVPPVKVDIACRIDKISDIDQ